jgi:two-component system, sensor histidine kinase and response regulator
VYLGILQKKKKLEREIQDKEKRFSDVAEASGEYIWELNANGEYIFLTKPFEDMLGYTIEESLGKTPFSFMPQDEEIRVGDYFMNQVAPQGIPFRGLIHKSITKNGEIIWQQVNGLPMFDQNGSIVGYRGAGLDITSAKNAQDELENAKAKAESASKAKTEFLANMSHEIRTPMNAIIGLGDILDDMLSDTKQKEILHKINSSSKMLLGIINDILDYSKIEAGKLELENNNFNIEDILSQLKVMFEERASKKGLELYFHLKGEKVGLIFGDELRLTQVLTNLLSNAIKFTHSGNVTLKIELIQITNNEKAKISFSIEDSGIGMNTEQLNKLFKPFSQADSSTTRKYGGTGLGLVISKNIVKAMGGNIEVWSQEKVGTRFYFTLDFNLASCEFNQNIQNNTFQKVLIVDDQEISREVLKDMLNRFGCSFDEASNGLEAIELIRAEDSKDKPYDILLIDWNMPLLNGVKTIEKLQDMYNQKELKAKIPTIFMISAYSKEDIDLEKIKIDCFISKPVTPSSLFDAMVDAKGGNLKSIDTLKTANTPNLSGLHILIVEDNEINQEVVSLMLKKVGISYEIASNGKEGVEKFLEDEHKFDIILMDLQMPIMGGYEATQKIRQFNKKIPIVALTAAAMVEDKEKSFQMGMNEHISKPIDKNELYRVISQLSHIKIAYQDTKKDSKEVLDTKYLEENITSQKLINSLLQKFKTQLVSGEFENIVDILKAKEAQASEKVHSLKGVSGNIGAFELCDILTSIDSKFKKHEEISDSDIEKLRVAKERLLQLLNNIKDSDIVNDDYQKLSTIEMIELLEKAKQMLLDGILIEDDVIRTLYGNLTTIIPSDELLQWKEYIQEYEFDEAFKIMQGWKI